MRVAKPWFRKATKTWYVQFKGTQISLGPDKKEAFNKYARLLHEKGFDDGGHSCTLHVLIDAYLDWMETNLAATTVSRALPVFQSLKAGVGDLPAEKLKPFQVSKWIQKTKAKSPTTIRNRIAAVVAMYNWGRRYGYVETNPIDQMPKPRARIRQEFVPPERFAELLGYIKHAEFRDFVFVMLDSGARAQEMFDFEAHHFKGDRLTLEIEDSKGQKRSRVVYLPAASLAIVERLAAQYPMGKLFRNSRGKPYSKESVRKHFRTLKSKIGMPALCATTLRHSFAHARLVAGQDALTVSKLMGHSSLKMLATRYGHLEGSSFLADEANRVNPLAVAIDSVGPNGESAPTDRSDDGEAFAGKASA